MRQRRRRRTGSGEFFLLTIAQALQVKLSGRQDEEIHKGKGDPSGLQHPLSSSSPATPPPLVPPVALINEFIRAPNLHFTQMTSLRLPPLYSGVEGNPQESV